ncbi:MAG: tetratricopeptide repeat protein, partial [Candidatus Eisenbacteria bacterium]|nr:tetratricopeptide repeat protein [Candidatus Eisenbacteria bacterium]
MRLAMDRDESGLMPITIACRERRSTMSTMKRVGVVVFIAAVLVATFFLFRPEGWNEPWDTEELTAQAAPPEREATAGGVAAGDAREVSAEPPVQDRKDTSETHEPQAEGKAVDLNRGTEAREKIDKQAAMEPAPSAGSPYPAGAMREGAGTAAAAGEPPAVTGGPSSDTAEASVEAGTRPASDYLYAVELLQAGDAERAAAILAPMVANGPRDRISRVKIRTNLTRAYLALDRPRNALPLAEAATRLDDESSAAWNVRGRALLALKRSEEALRAFQESVELDPENLHALNNLGY